LHEYNGADNRNEVTYKRIGSMMFEVGYRESSTQVADYYGYLDYWYVCAYAWGESGVSRAGNMIVTVNLQEPLQSDHPALSLLPSREYDLRCRTRSSSLAGQ
jgi:hypothetical protein